MKKSTPLIIFALVALILSGCAKKITITKGQAATMSQQALDTLKTLRIFKIPLIKPSDKMIIKARAQFAAMEKGQLEEMEKRFHPLIKDTLINNVKVKVITPENIKAENRDKIMIYIHGGGYVLGSATDRTGMLMTNELGFKTYAIDYQLAPEAKYPVALNECLAVYKYLVSIYDPNKIVGVSTSAGSGHMLGMLLKAQQAHLPMIRAIGLLSPAVDLTGNGDAITANSNANRDLLAYKNQADKFYVAPFVGNASTTDPLVSPIYATYTSDFPATVIATGTRDSFLSGSARLYWKLRDVNVDAELLVSEGMWHAFTNYADIPEAIQSRKAVEDFFIKELKKKN